MLLSFCSSDSAFSSYLYHITMDTVDQLLPVRVLKKVEKCYFYVNRDPLFVG